ncbi:extracellular triacylglycerol lipase precursor [Fomes fomentarius]|nr:extracellular triacylglycerol lipase precursor [Fomes fomentarius]
MRAFAFVALLLAFPVNAQPSPQVTFGNSTITGLATTVGGEIGVDFFGGIPFAEPPVANLRFAPPVPKNAADVGVLNATQFGASCVQFNLAAVSEDCLTLNVFRPSSVSSYAALPVMVWIYGGGFSGGTSAIFNASAIIAQSVARGTPVVYVSVNYRIGPFGFPQGSEADQKGALNLGLKDQLAGLRWVQSHISAFGGDPTKVTVFGESAGAISIGDLYLNSGLENLARAAIFESGSASTVPLLEASRRQVVWDTFVSKITPCANATQSDTFSCAQSVDTASLLTAWQQTAGSFPEPFLFVPVLDGPDGIIPDLPSKLLAAGKFSKIPFIAGTNLDEGTSFTPTTISTEQELVQLLTIEDFPFADPPPTFEQDVATLLELYPDDPTLGSPFGTGNETFGLSSTYKRASAIIGDASFQATRRQWIQAATAAGVKAFGYLFADQNAVSNPAKGVTHGSEVVFVYGQVAASSANPAERLLSQAMLDYWISFAVNLTPNDGKGLSKTNWPEYQPDEQVLLQFDTTNFTSSPSFASFSVIPDDYRSKQISFINSIAGDLGE